jgi:hypothetical protein
MTISTIEEVELLIIKSAQVIGIVVICLSALKHHLNDLIHWGSGRSAEINKRTERRQDKTSADDDSGPKRLE